MGVGVVKRIKLNIRSVSKTATDSQDTVDLPGEVARTENNVILPQARMEAQVAEATIAVEAPTVATALIVETMAEEEVAIPEEVDAQAQVVINNDTTPPPPRATPPPSIATEETPPPLPTPPAGTIPTVTVNNTDWYDDTRATKLPINGLIMERDFAIKTSVGETITRRV